MVLKRKIIYSVAAMAIVAVVATLVAVVTGDGTVVLPTKPSREQYPVRGIDVSAHNGIIDFEAVRNDSVDFVLIKATEGSDFRDRRFRQNIEAAKAAGLKVGVYHFFRFDATGYMQGLNLLDAIRDYSLDLPVAIDVEEWSNPREWGTEAVVARLNELISYLNRHGYRVMLYSNKDGFERFIAGRLEHIPLWLATFSRPEGRVDWKVWQYSHRGSVAGIGSRVDLNVFNGSRAEWEAWIAGN